ncbi:MAG: cell division protein ZapE [Gammaproteobacteria bacterium]|nr:cell division protein ZapE [Gammaproteobacteria bacterium]
MSPDTAAPRTPAQRFEFEIARHGFTADPAQLAAVALLERVHREMCAVRTPARRDWLGRLLRRAPEATPGPRGAYLWGSVGRGKTFIVDTFYECLPPQSRLRLHFHSFMRKVHHDLKACRQLQDPLDVVAARWAEGLRILCLDEFHVSDITDAMILANLLEGLFNRGVTLVTTSNEPPGNLYRGGLQRERFLPAIALLEQHLEVFELMGATDYRLRALKQAEVYHSPLGPAADAALAQGFDIVATGPGEAGVDLDIEERRIPTRRLAEGVVWFDFATLCGGPRSTADYIEIARCFHTVVIGDVPLLGEDDNDATRRFINLIDEFYDRNVKLLVSAAAAPDALYGGSRLATVYQRTVSRLREMQSEGYLARPHLMD